jgi:hypothetical protein
MKISKPYREAQIGHITQGFHKDHKALDFGYKYGTWLTAPFNCVAERITDALVFETMTKFELERGYGLLMRSTEDPTITCSYWHTLPFFPIKEGDIILRGQPVAQMGNSGFVYGSGEYVPLNKRTDYPYSGTHLHWGMSEDWTNKIDWNEKITFDVATAIGLTLQSIINFFKKQ